jgi:hypothetical protein
MCGECVEQQGFIAQATQQHSPANVEIVRADLRERWRLRWVFVG